MLGGGGFNMGAMPKAVTCYICGRGYGTKSIGIHLKNCEQKWNIEQEQKPKKDRRPCPQPPKNFNKVLGKENINRKDLEELNNEAFNEYNETALEKCQICGRTFNSESMKVHRRICTIEKPFKPAPGRQVIQAKPPTLEPIPQKGLAASGPPRGGTSEPPRKDPKAAPSGPPREGGSPNPRRTTQTSNFVIFRPGNSHVQEKAGSPKPEKDTFKLAKKKSLEFKLKAPPKAEFRPPQPAQPDPVEDMEEFDDSAPKEACAKCGREFNSDRLDKHQKVCKVNLKPKKVRLFHKPPSKSELEKKEPKGVPAWKQQHQDLVNNMKYMRKMKAIEESGGDIRSLPPPPPSQNPGFQECPFCARKFAKESFERHTNVCRNVVNKPKGVPKPAKVVRKF